MIMEIDRIYFAPGDIVRVRHDSIEFVPNMWVVDKVTRNIKNSSGDTEPMFLGIRCRWFNAVGDLQESVFSTKDLVKVE